MSAIVGLSLAALLAAPAQIRLQALTATSGTGAEALLDGNPAAGWKPAGDPVDEGVLLRFEAPVRVDFVELASCGGTYSLEAFVNGRRDPQVVSFPVKPGPGLGPGVHVGGRSPRVQSLFLRIAEAKDAPCVGEIRFHHGGTTLPVAPPRKVTGKVSATSTLAPDAAYHPSYLFDSRLDFGWVEGAKGTGEGEAVTIELDEPLAVTAVEIWNGYQRSPVHFEKNARARKVALQLDGGAPLPFELKDAQGPQRLALPSPTSARKIRLTVVSAYPGTKYPDLVLSELRFWDAEGPVGVRTRDAAALGAGLTAAVRGTPLAKLLGVRLSNACEDPDVRRTFKVRDDHTFVAYEAACEETGEGCSSEVFDGTWVLASGTATSAEIELFGRRHRADETWDPYSETPGKRVKETDRIAGGKLRIARAADVSGPERQRVGVRVDAPCTGGYLVFGPPLTDVFLPDAR